MSITAHSRPLGRVTELDALRIENQILRERIAEIEGLLCDETLVPQALNLTRSERRIFGALMKRQSVRREALIAVLYRDLGKEPRTPHTVDVLLSKTRKKLAAVGIVVATAWGCEWRLDASEKAKARAMLAAEQASGPMQ